jgi:N-methylhydantoinase A
LGYDPRDFTLVAFGGAGPLHAARLARELSIPRVLVPEVPGILCALGLLVTDMRSDYTLTRILEASRPAVAEMRSIFSELGAQARRWLNQEGVNEKDRLYRYSVDMRYQGQNYELNVSLDSEELTREDLTHLVRRFHLLHEQNYGYSSREEQVQMVTFCLEALGRVPKVALKTYSRDGFDSRHALVDTRQVFLEEKRDLVDCPVYRRDLLRHGNMITGPAIVEQMDSTTLVLPGQEAFVDSYHNILIHVFGGNDRKRGVV